MCIRDTYLLGYSDRTPAKYTMTFPKGYNAPSLKQENLIVKRVVPENYESVSYTHLDVYKRQMIYKSRAYAIFSYFHPLFQAVALSAHSFNAIAKPNFTQRFPQSCKDVYKRQVLDKGANRRL